MSRIAAIYQDFRTLQDALKQLSAQGYTEDSFDITHASDPHTDLFPPGYDPIGGARFAGSPIGTMASTGGNLVGNSVTMDVNFHMLPKLLASVADIEEEGEDNATPTSYLLTVDGDHDQIISLMQETGGEVVNFNVSDK